MIGLEYSRVAGRQFVESLGYDLRGNLLRHIDIEAKSPNARMTLPAAR